MYSDGGERRSPYLLGVFQCSQFKKMLFSFGRKHGFIPIACLSASLSAALRRAPEVGVKGVAAVVVPAVALVTAHLPVL